MQVKELTIEELKLLIQETVAETIQSLLVDSDDDRPLRPEVKQLLLNSLQAMKCSPKTGQVDQMVLVP